MIGLAMASSLLVSSPLSPRCYAPATSKLSFTHFSKHLAGTLSRNPIQTPKTSRYSQTPLRLPLLSVKAKPHLFRCSNSRTSSSFPEKNLSFDLSGTISQLTPLGFCKWSLIFVTGCLAARLVVNNLLLDPFFWVYFDWLLVFLPRIGTCGLGVYGIYALYKHLNGGANEIEQVGLILSILNGITRLPHIYFYGVVYGWPIVYLWVYLFYFIFLNASIRKLFYGGIYPLRENERDPKWERSLPNWSTGLFCGALVVAHWLAAYESTLLPINTKGWLNPLGIWVLILTSFVVNGLSMWYIGKYSEKLVIPTGVVQSGLYRWFRHPMYASTMFLLASYFIALKTPFSLLLVVAASFAYYEQKTKLEETMLLESFGEVYKAYMDKVRSKYIPFIY